MNGLFKKAEKTVKKYNMLSKGDKVLIGISGGSDSVFLLYFLNGIRDKYHINLHVAHLNHGFRKEAKEEADFVKRLAKNLGISCTLKKIDVPSYAKEKKLSKQEAAREIRYSFLRDVANKIGANKIALGHTADDQAETFLMKILRGAGAKGMGGIHPLYKTLSGQTVIRPLIEIGRKEIMDYLNGEGIRFINDPSNISNYYLRNRIRNELIPYLEQGYNPRIKDAFVRSAEILREEDLFLESFAEGLLPKLTSLERKGRIEVFLDPFLSLDKVIQRRIIRMVIEKLKGNLKGYSMHHIDEVIESIATGQTGRKINLPKGIVAQRDYSLLSFYLKELKPKTQDSRYNVIVPGVTKIPEFALTIHAEIKKPPVILGNRKIVAAFDFDKISERLGIRKRKERDFFFPLGMGGKSKKLKRYFIDEKIKRDERNKIPILVAGDDIIWVIGHRQDERYKVFEKTKKILLIKAEGGIYGKTG